MIYLMDFGIKIYQKMPKILTASAEKKLDDEELISYVLVGLDAEYNTLAPSIAARVEAIILGELYSQLLTFENRLDL
jgi:hypothetical protein